MAKLLILDGQGILTETELNRDGNKFVFIVTDDKRVYHLDTSDGNMWKAREKLQNLGKPHQIVIKRVLSEIKTTKQNNKKEK